jgi:hypothetical protein
MARSDDITADLSALFDDADEIRVTGAAATIRCRVAAWVHVDESQDVERDARRAIADNAAAISREMFDHVAKRLGTQFSMEPIAVRSGGSFFVIAVIMTLAPVIITYGNLRTGLDYLTHDFSVVVGKMSGGAAVGVEARPPTPETGLLDAERIIRLSRHRQNNDVVTLYLIALNTVLVLALIAFASVLLAHAL